MLERKQHPYYFEQYWESYAEDNDNYNDLVRIADAGDYETAFNDYLLEGDEDMNEGITLEDFVRMLNEGSIRYCEKADGIYYINDWSN